MHSMPSVPVFAPGKRLRHRCTLLRLVRSPSIGKGGFHSSGKAAVNPPASLLQGIYNLKRLVFTIFSFFTSPADGCQPSHWTSIQTSSLVCW